MDWLEKWVDITFTDCCCRSSGLINTNVQVMCCDIPVFFLLCTEHREGRFIRECYENTDSTLTGVSIIHSITQYWRHSWKQLSLCTISFYILDYSFWVLSSFPPVELVLAVCTLIQLPAC